MPQRSESKKKNWFLRLVSWLNPSPWFEYNGKTKEGKHDVAGGIKFSPEWKGDDGNS